jgi:hypothetical protein
MIDHQVWPDAVFEEELGAGQNQVEATGRVQRIFRSL